MARMFESFLPSIPASRSEMVQDLEIPDLTLSPYIWDPDPVDKLHKGSITSSEEDEMRSVSVNTDSSIALSRAVTDSEIDYDRYKRYKRMNLSNRWEALSRAMDAFPVDHISLLSSLHSDTTSESSDQTEDSIPREPWLRNEELLLRLRKSFDEDCLAYEPDDPCFLELEEALLSLNLEPLYADWDKLTF